MIRLNAHWKTLNERLPKGVVFAFCILLFLCAQTVFAQEADVDTAAIDSSSFNADAIEDSSSVEPAPVESSAVDSSDVESPAVDSKTDGAEEKSGVTFVDVISWPFVHILQPVFSVVVYPVSAPVNYIIENGVAEKSVELVTFGERNNILVYPTMNLKPGASTMLGATYRHRSILLSRDYLVVDPQYFANGDWQLGARYSKQELFGLPMYGNFRIQKFMNRDAGFVIPETKKSYVQPDSSLLLNGRLGFPIFGSGSHWSMGLRAGYEWKIAGLPENASDSILISEDYPVDSRGLYQHFEQVPLEASVLFDNLDFPYAPSRGSRFYMSGTYVFVRGYDGVDFTAGEYNTQYHYKDNGANHNFVRTETVFQHYFYIGRAPQFHLSGEEAKESRRYYLDFSLDNALRPWYPSNVANTLFERRVVAIQLRMMNLWEMEKGEAPYNAFPVMNTRLPLRGFSAPWSAHHIIGMSAEYRWPIDRLVDGVAFDEYGLVSETISGWSKDKFYNSWGFGIRVRRPDMYWFRVQLGFHGLHGVNLVMTIAPEFY